MIRKPKCMYCGEYMESQYIEKIGKWNFWCPECGSESPVKDTEKEAYNEALAGKYQTPLSVDETFIHQAVWIELRDGQMRPMVMSKNLKSRYAIAEYGFAWRAWLGYPSEKARNQAAWNQHSILEACKPSSL